MSPKPRLLDLFCCQGGAGMGYNLAGFEVRGVDKDEQPRYPFEMAVMHALDYLQKHSQWADAIHASPPCQAYTNAQKIQNRKHPELIAELRLLLELTGKPYVIENVLGAPPKNPIMLCGASFGLKVYRHRIFEANFPIVEPLHPQHQWDNVKMGRQPKDGEFIQPVGHFTDVEFAKEEMGIDWMDREGLREAIPPAYTQWIGLQMKAYLLEAA